MEESSEGDERRATTLEKGPVDVYRLGESMFLVYEPDSIEILQTHHRIIGSFVGTLSAHHSQNQFLGPPLCLSTEEVLIGMHEGFVRVYTDGPQCYLGGGDLDDAMWIHDQEDMKAGHVVYEKERELAFNVYYETVLKPKKLESLKYKQKAGVTKESKQSKKQRKLEGKKRKRGDEEEEHKQTSGNVDGAIPPIFGQPLRKKQRVSIFTSASTAIQDVYYYLVNQTTSLVQSVKDTTSSLFASLSGSGGASFSIQTKHDRAIKSGDLTQNASQYASTTVDLAPLHDERGIILAKRDMPTLIPGPKQSYEEPTISRRNQVSMSEIVEWCLSGEKNQVMTLHRFAVMHDLWKRGFYLGDGCKFGATVMAYPGDPTGYHAAILVNVVEYKTKSINILDLVGEGRLGSATKKLSGYGFLPEVPSMEFSPDKDEELTTASKKELRKIFSSSQIPAAEFLGVLWHKTLP